MKLNAEFLRWAVGAVALLCVTLALSIHPTIKADLYALLKDDSIPFESILNKNANSVQIVFESDSEAAALKTAKDFYANLDPNDYASVRFEMSQAERKAQIQGYFEHRSRLLSDHDRALMQRGDYESVQKNAYRKLTTSVMPQLVAYYDDPFFLLADYLQALIKPQGMWQLKNGFMMAHKDGKSYVLMILNLKTFSVEQVDALLLVKDKVVSREVNIYLSGTPIHSAQSMKESITQINLFSCISIFFVLVLIYLLLGSIKWAALILTNLLVACVVGYCGLLIFPTQHLITFIFATSLIGLSIDYSFHFLSTPKAQQKRLVKCLLQAYLTTIVCLCPLLFSSLDVLKQIAVFTILGLTSVLINTLLFYPLFYKSPKAQQKIHWRIPRFLLLVAFCFGLWGVFGAHYQTDVNALYTPDARNFKADKLVAELSGLTSTKLLLVRAPSIEALLQKEEALKEKHGAFYSLSTLSPSLKRQQENQTLQETLFARESQNLREKLDLSEPLSLTKTPPLTPDKQWLDLFVFSANGQFYSITPIEQDIKADDAITLSPRDYLSQKLNDFAKEAYVCLAASSVILLVMLFLFYGKKVWLYLAPCVLAILCVLGVLALTNTSVNFFHVLSFFIVLGVGIDYTIFNMSGFTNKAVLFSFLSSFVGLGLLSFASFELIASMGLVLGLGLLLAFVFSLAGAKDESVV